MNIRLPQKRISLDDYCVLCMSCLCLTFSRNLPAGMCLHACSIYPPPSIAFVALSFPPNILFPWFIVYGCSPAHEWDSSSSCKRHFTSWVPCFCNLNCKELYLLHPSGHVLSCAWDCLVVLWTLLCFNACFLSCFLETVAHACSPTYLWNLSSHEC